MIVGLVAAVISGVVAYRTVGLYGDGPFSYGYFRERDPQTGESILYRIVEGPNGEEIRQVVDMPNRRITEVQTDLDGDGRVERVTREDDALAISTDVDDDGVVDLVQYTGLDDQGLRRVGFSLTGDGVIDAWAWRDADDRIVRVDVSTRQDDLIDRREFYDAAGQLARVELDTDRNGTTDQWQIYEGGILFDTILDANADGQPDAPLPPLPGVAADPAN